MLTETVESGHPVSALSRDSVKELLLLCNANGIPKVSGQSLKVKWLNASDHSRVACNKRSDCVFLKNRRVETVRLNSMTSSSTCIHLNEPEVNDTSSKDVSDRLHTAFFAWGPPNDSTKSVKVLVSKAQGIYCNNFRQLELEREEQIRKYSSYVLEQRNEGGSFSAVVKLEPGIYHFLFHVVEEATDNFATASEQTSPFYERTYLAPGKEVNYIDLSPKALAMKPGKDRADYEKSLQKKKTQLISEDNEVTQQWIPDSEPSNKCLLL